jgi:regulator of protease activity HflC (stomatin/prohibitin superfamily)
MTFTNGFQVVLIGGGVLAVAYMFILFLRKLLGAIKINRTVVVVNEYERGVKYVQGKLAGVVQPGRYAWWGDSQRI